MSRVAFRGTTKDGIAVEVVGGWDRPLSYYHFTIFDLRDTEEETVLYSCLDEKNMRQFQTNAPHERTLARFGIEAPEGFWERADQKLGNAYFECVNGVWSDAPGL